MSEQISTQRCNRCNSELSGPFCAHCGHPQSLRRINGPYILSELAGVFNFQKGILFTVRELLVRPGDSVRKFIHEDRNGLVKPINFIILCSLVYIIAQQSLHFQDGYIDFSGFDWGDSAVVSVMAWISQNYGFANILMATFIAIWIRVFFRKYEYNFFEVLILLYFAMGVQMLIYAVLGVAESMSGFRILDTGSSVGIIYVCWAIGQFFDRRKKINYLKGLLGYFLGLISFTIVAIIGGLFIDWILK